MRSHQVAVVGAIGLVLFTWLGWSLPALAVDITTQHGTCALREKAGKRTVPCTLTHLDTDFELSRQYQIDDQLYFVKRSRPNTKSQWVVRYGKHLAEADAPGKLGKASLCTQDFMCKTPDWTVEFTPDA